MLEEFVLEDLVIDIVEEVGRTTDKKLIISGSSNKKVLGDPDRIGQVLINFLTNAIKYSPHTNNHVFERFYRVEDETHTTIPGIGLGLYFTLPAI